MAEYYLISQLPSLDGIADNAPLPITEERFSELCNRFLGKRAKSEFDKLTLSPPPDLERTSSALINAQNENERNLRLALAKVRAEKMKMVFDTGDYILPDEVLQTARTATEITNPMEAERFLSNYRLAFLEAQRPTDTFSDDYVFYYWFKLKLLLYMRQFDAEKGEAAYRNIYHSVLNGVSLEAIQ